MYYVERNIDGTDPEYEILGKLGRGGFGTVYKAKRKSDNTVVAKKVMYRNGYGQGCIVAELEALKRLATCRNVVGWYKDVVNDESRGETHLHMKYYPLGDLSAVIWDRYNKGKPIPQFMALDWFLDLTAALADCHDKGILHRDIKDQNILLRDVECAKGPNYPTGLRLAAFLTDFGVAKFTKAAIGHKNNTIVGTPTCMAPEVLNGTFGAKSEVFSLGCVMYAVCELQRAFVGDLKIQRPDMKGTHSNYMKRAVLACLRLDMESRPSVYSLTEALKLLDSTGTSLTLKSEDEKYYTLYLKQSKRSTREIAKSDKRPISIVDQQLADFIEFKKKLKQMKDNQPGNMGSQGLEQCQMQ